MRSNCGPKISKLGISVLKKTLMFEVYSNKIA
jgi:hypothetical protein